MSDKKRGPRPFPSKEQILDFIRESAGPVGKREIARAFNLRGEDRSRLKELLRELRTEGVVERGRGRRVHPPRTLPEVTVIEISGVDADGELIGTPTVWHGEGKPPLVYVAPERRGRPALTQGDRVLARLKRLADGTFEAQPIRLIAAAPREVIGVFRATARGGRVQSTDRRHKSDFHVDTRTASDVRPGDLIRGEILPGRHHGLPVARIVERIGTMDDPQTVSLIAIHTHDIPTEFPSEALRLARRAEPVTRLGARTDLRRLPLVTIDGPDARDFDDAVWAEPDAANEGGFHLVVAIADVAHYVRPGDALDKTAFERGNSVYFPDRVVPMLPEELSNNLCSLRPGEDRACLAAHLWVDGRGHLRRHRFERALMRSAARLTYEQVQAAHDGRADETTKPLLKTVIAPLYGAYRVLARARKRRGTLDLEIPERQVILDAAGHIDEIKPRARYDSHRLIEEFMIAANVAAAETLESLNWPCMFRVHEPPDPLKVEALAAVLDDLGFHLDPGRKMKPAEFGRILDAARGDPNEALINELVLRAQSQAVYSPENRGHFGLALRRYCHFTSPIRRYADLLVHRALISALRLGDDGLRPEDGGRFSEMGEHISLAERRAQAAERDALDRYLTVFLAKRVGQTFAGRITGVTRFGLFVRLEIEGAEGLVPVRSLGAEHFIHDEVRHALIGQHSDTAWVLGDGLQVRLVTADTVTGGLVFEIVSEARTRPASVPRPSRHRTSRPPKRRRHAVARRTRTH